MNFAELGIAQSREYVSPKRLKGLLHEATLLPTGVFREAQRLMHDEKGKSDSGLAILLATGVSLTILITVLMQTGYDKGQSQKIAALQNQVAALTTPVAAQVPELTVIEVKESPAQLNDYASWYQGEVTIRLSNDFRPSKTNGTFCGSLAGSRRQENLINWENILEINNTSISGAEAFRVENPLVACGTGEEIPDKTFLDRFRGPLNRFPQYDLIKLRAVVKNESGQLERRYVYLPANTPESQSYVEDYARAKGPRIYIEEKADHYYHHAFIGEQNLGEIPSNQIGIVTVIPQ